MTSPHWLYQHLLADFHPGEPTAEIGCGQGERVWWLAQQGFPVTGYGSVTPDWSGQTSLFPPAFAVATLPELKGVPDQAYRNVLLVGILSTIPREDLITAVFSLARILQPGGRLVLTVPAGGLNFPVGKLVLLLESTGLMVSKNRTLDGDGDRPTALLIVEKTILQVARGLERVQSVLVRDAKFATYKLALIRAFCGVARNEPHLVRWGSGQVYVPLWSLARRWLIYYWSFFTGPQFVAQQRGEAPASGKPIAFRSTIVALADTFGPGGLQLLLDELDAQPERFLSAMQRIAQTIKAGPVTHAGNAATPIFSYSRTSPVGAARSLEGRFGWVVVPESIWLDISRFHHWIEDSLILRWAQLTVEMNSWATIAEVLPYLLYAPQQERDTTEVRDLLLNTKSTLRCVWTDASLERGFEVDHVIPYSAWGNNDLWNLLPSHPKVNGQKSDCLPTRQLLLERREAVTGYWQRYFAWSPARFSRQVERALGVAAGHSGWERAVFAGFQETVERVAAIQGLERWRP